MDKTAILAAIASGELDGDLDTLAIAVQAAVDRRLRERPAPSLAVGDRVYFNALTGRKSAVGQTGTIVGKATKNFDVKLDRPDHRQQRGRWVEVTTVRAPGSILSPLPADYDSATGVYLPALGL
jgi:co-chaperonin GroES (HSP10)